ncbi:unnamed protein product [Closterium sp. NIES-54]
MHLARVLSATCRNAVKQRGTVAVPPSLPVALQHQRRHQSGQQSGQLNEQQSGLADFFEQGRTPDAPVTTGTAYRRRGWQAWELRHKSFEDLHGLWYVLLKEKNLLYSQKQMLQSQGRRMVQPHRIRLSPLSLSSIARCSLLEVSQKLSRGAAPLHPPREFPRSMPPAHSFPPHPLRDAPRSFSQPLFPPHPLALARCPFPDYYPSPSRPVHCPLLSYIPSRPLTARPLFLLSPLRPPLLSSLPSLPNTLSPLSAPLSRLPSLHSAVLIPACATKPCSDGKSDDASETDAFESDSTIIAVVLTLRRCCNWLVQLDPPPPPTVSSAPPPRFPRRLPVPPALPFRCSSPFTCPPLVRERGERAMAAQRAPPSFRLRAYYGIDFPGKVAVLVAQSLLSFALAATLFGRYAAAVALVRRFWPLLPAQFPRGVLSSLLSSPRLHLLPHLLCQSPCCLLLIPVHASHSISPPTPLPIPSPAFPHPQLTSFLVGFSAAFALLLAFAYSLTLSANLRTSLLLRPRLARHMLALVPAWQPVRTALDLGSGRGVLLASLGLQLLECGGEGRAIGFDSWETKSHAAGGGANGGFKGGSRLEVERSRALKGAAAGSGDADAGDGVSGAAAAADGADGASADVGASGSSSNRSSSSGRHVRHRRADKAKAGHPGRSAAGGTSPGHAAPAAPASGLAGVSAPAVGSMAGALRAAAREGVGALVTCKTGAFDRLPFPDAYFDIVVSALRLHAIASVRPSMPLLG